MGWFCLKEILGSYHSCAFKKKLLTKHQKQEMKGFPVLSDNALHLRDQQSPLKC